MRAANAWLRAAGPALAFAAVTLGCSELYGLKKDVPSGSCSTNADCAPDEICLAGTCNPLAAAGGSAGSAGASGAGSTAGSNSSAGSGSTAGSSGSSGTAGAGTSGSAGSGGTPTCSGTAIGDSIDCYELPDGTAINFPGGMPQGPCMAGSKVCQSDASFGKCLGAVPPGQTDCSASADQNCNGKADNSECGVCTVAATQYCYDGPTGSQGVGPCQQGTQVCQLDASGTSAVWGPCAGEITPAMSDTCDSGNDATCNNIPNEGCTCINGQSGGCGAKLGALGNCAGGTSKCVNGAWGTCSITPKVNDTCDSGDDATCNGKANEGCACLNGAQQGCGVSAMGCTTGIQTCSNGSFGACSGGCGDFPVGNPGTRCYINGPIGEDAENTCDILVCAAGYHVQDCSAYVYSGNGNCSFNGGTGEYGNVTSTKALQSSNVTCALSSCTCRLDGY